MPKQHDGIPARQKISLRILCPSQILRVLRLPLHPDNDLNSSSWEKLYLKALFLLNLKHGPAEATELARQVGEPYDRTKRAILELEEMGYVIKTQAPSPTSRGVGGLSLDITAARFSLSEKGRKRLIVVMTGGVFDILHVGHLSSFEEAKALGDVLVVVVARDSTVQRLKHRAPINNELQRMRLLNALSIVDLALLGDETDFLKSIERIEPDIIAIGYDQKYDVAQLSKDLNLRGLHAKIVRLRSHVPGIKSSKILSKIQDANSLNRDLPL